MSSRKILIADLLRRCLSQTLFAALLLAVAAACGPAVTPTPVPIPTASPAALAPTMAPQHGWELPAGQVLFIDRHVRVDGTCLEGDCQPGPMIDFPTYGFDPETGILDSRLPLDVNDDLKVVYGNGTSLRGVAGGGAATGLTEVYAVPAEIQGLRFVQVDRDGTAYLEHGGELLVLAPGQTWTNTTEEIQEQGTGKASFTTTDTIVNYGILDKSKIVFPTQEP
ncbi:MAG: hypothetical protein EHM56_04675 [Chloroflexi bacterium]|nr:MAG: hypothetical protein EHM56_04675 [Chloroflexota bacterium]